MELLNSVFSWFSGDHHSWQQKQILREKNKDRNINCFYWCFPPKSNFKWKQSIHNGKFGERILFLGYKYLKPDLETLNLFLLSHTSISCKFNGQTLSPVTPMQNGSHLYM